MKKIKVLFIIFIMLFVLSSVVLAEQGINVFINGEKQTYEQQPIVKNGRTLVPFRDIFVSLGANNITWDGTTQTVEAKREDTLITLQIGSDKAYINGNLVILDQPAEIVNGRTMVPLRFVSESLNADVNWDGATQTINISYDNTLSEYNLNDKLLEASSNNNLGDVKNLLEQGANPDIQHSVLRTTPLINASFYGYTDIVNLLLTYEANPNIADISGWTPLMYASLNGDMDISKLLLEENININAQDKDGLNALMIAINNGNSEIASLLLNNNINPSVKDNDGWTALTYASKLGDLNILQELIYNYDFDINQADNDNITALMYAADAGNIEVVQELLNSGANVNLIDKDGWSALNYASYSGYKGIVEILLDNGADIDQQDTGDYGGCTSLLYALDNGYEEIANILIDRGADPYLSDIDGWNALFYAVNYGYNEILNKLIDLGMEVDGKDIYGATPLMYASFVGNTETVNILLANDADPNLTDNDGWTALMDASNMGYYNIVSILLDNGANPDLKDNDGWTALMNAANNGYDKTLNILLDYNADPNIFDNDEMSAIIYAAGNGYYTIVETLLNHPDFDMTQNAQGLYAKSIAQMEGYDDVASLIDEQLLSINSSYEINNNSTEDSSITLTGSINSDNINYVWVEIIGDEDDKVKNLLIPVENNEINKRIFLPFGSGEYTLIINEGRSIDDYYYENKQFNVINVDDTNRYLLPSEYVESDSEEIINLANEITVGLDSDLEKSRAIHDWVATNIRYDIESYINGIDNNHTALETLQIRSTDCDGYSRLTAALHRAVGIEAKVVWGDTIDVSTKEEWDNIPDHVWNEVNIDGEWIIIDTTWDAGYINEYNSFKKELSHDYFNPSSEEFAKGHRKMEESYE